MNNLLNGIRKGIDFLFNAQTPEGSFPDSIFYIEQNNWNKLTGTIFSASLIAHSINEILRYKHLIPDDLVSKCSVIKKNAFSFFIKEMIMPGLWKYSPHTDEKWKCLPLDVDDTCCVSYLLKDFHPYIHFGLNKSIILKNMNGKGLFYTWFLPEDKSSFNNIDSIVNVNALLYLGETIDTIKVIDYICNLVNNNNETGSFYYYTDVLCMHYLISRAYAAGVTGFERCRDSIIKKITTKNLNSMNELYLAVSISTLMNFNYTIDSNLNDKIKNLIDCQCENGSWRKYPFYQGGAYPEPVSICSGSESISTAFCLEALVKYFASIIQTDQ